jgi:hypothetical protein
MEKVLATTSKSTHKLAKVNSFARAKRKETLACQNSSSSKRMLKRLNGAGRTWRRSGRNGRGGRGCRLRSYLARGRVRCDPPTGETNVEDKKAVVAEFTAEFSIDDLLRDTDTLMTDVP